MPIPEYTPGGIVANSIFAKRKPFFFCKDIKLLIFWFVLVVHERDKSLRQLQMFANIKKGDIFCKL